MKKSEDIISIFVYLIMIAAVIIVSFVVIKPIMEQMSTKQLWTGNSYLFAFIALFVGIIGNALLFELGHLIGGKLGGYSIISFNVLFFCVYKKASKWKFKFSSFDGLTGETKLAPKSDKANPKAYLLFGTVFYLLEVVAVFLVYFLTKTPELQWNAVSLFLLIIAVVGGLLAIYNIIPFKLDSLNDGYRLTLLSKKDNRVAFNEMLRVQNEIDNGNSDPDIKVFDTITNFTAEINMLTIYKHYRKEEFKEAAELLKKIIDSPSTVNEKILLNARVQYLYVLILTKTKTEAKKYYDESFDQKTKKVISEKNTIEFIRSYVLIAGILDDSQGEVAYAMNKSPKALRQCPKGIKLTEETLYNKAVDLVKETHKEWNLDFEELSE